MLKNIEELAEKIQSANSLVLSTHRQCDGDGLGAQIGLFHALKDLGKDVRILNVDGVPSKYSFLEPEKWVQSFEDEHDGLKETDLALILDTNDRRLVEPLYTEFEKHCKEIGFIDHHPQLKQGPAPTDISFLNPKAASTGEIAFDLINTLNAKLSPAIARAIYTSIAFDTQLFRYVRNSPTSHLIAAELLKHETNPAEVHQHLFANHTVDKIRFLSRALEKIEYHQEDRIAVLKLEQSDLSDYNVNAEESRDLIDMIMNINTLLAGVMIREEKSNQFKVSLRSKGHIEVRGVAESIGGGGHLYASGATVEGSYDAIKKNIVDQLSNLIGDLHGPA